MKTTQGPLHQQAALADALHRAGRIALWGLAIAATLIIASSALTAALALPETLSHAQRW